MLCTAVLSMFSKLSTLPDWDHHIYPAQCLRSRQFMAPNPRSASYVPLNFCVPQEMPWVLELSRLAWGWIPIEHGWSWYVVPLWERQSRGDQGLSGNCSTNEECRKTGGNAFIQYPAQHPAIPSCILYPAMPFQVAGFIFLFLKCGSTWESPRKVNLSELLSQKNRNLNANSLVWQRLQNLIHFIQYPGITPVLARSCAASV